MNNTRFRTSTGCLASSWNSLSDTASQIKYASSCRLHVEINVASCHSKFAVYEVINCRTIVRVYLDLQRKCKYYEININTTVYIYIYMHIWSIIQPCHEKTCFMPCANNKDADQPAHLRSLFSVFVFHSLDSIHVIQTLVASKLSRL